MARANNSGWDFVKEGNIYQYKEEGCIAMVKIIREYSDNDKYQFDVVVLASDGNFPAGRQFSVMHTKNPGGYWNEMPQFYSDIEYIPLPLGKPWPEALSGYEYEGLSYKEADHEQD